MFDYSSNWTGTVTTPWGTFDVGQTPNYGGYGSYGGYGGWGDAPVYSSGVNADTSQMLVLGLILIAAVFLLKK